MKIGFRHYGVGNDNITLTDIKQIPNVKTIVWSLHYKQPGEVWLADEIKQALEPIQAQGFDGEVVESVNVSDEIKIASPKRDEHIDNYIKSIKALGEQGVKCICYNFMPVFDWFRTDLAKKCPDGSTAMYFSKSVVDKLTPEQMIANMKNNETGLTFPGWEPERLSKLNQVIDAYKTIDRDKAFANFKYFLDAIIPTCEQYDVKMAVHTDDPPWDLFGWPRIVSSEQDFAKILELNPSPYNGLTLCTGSFSSSPQNDAVRAVKKFHDRIHFTHIRNIKHFANGDFVEVSHRGADGSVDIVGVLQAYYDAGWNGYIRPDHGRHLWDEVDKDNGYAQGVRPGYGLYDRALGIMYINGVWDTLTKK